MTTIESPAVRVVKGNPDADELAALVASLLSAAVPARERLDEARGPAPRTAGWADPARSMRGGAAVPRAWRWSTHY